jgi:hypothetical protein
VPDFSMLIAVHRHIRSEGPLSIFIGPAISRPTMLLPLIATTA